MCKDHFLNVLLSFNHDFFAPPQKIDDHNFPKSNVDPPVLIKRRQGVGL